MLVGQLPLMKRDAYMQDRQSAFGASLHDVLNATDHMSQNLWHEKESLNPLSHAVPDNTRCTSSTLTTAQKSSYMKTNQGNMSCGGDAGSLGMLSIRS